MSDLKVCSKCGQEKILEQFTFDSTNQRYIAQCKSCKAAYMKAKYATEDVSIQRARQRKNRLMHRYGLTIDDYDRMLIAQEGHCALCPATEPGGRGEFFSVDHDHACCSGIRSCGKCVRGLLCLRCNNSLGWYEKHQEEVLVYLQQI